MHVFQRPFLLQYHHSYKGERPGSIFNVSKNRNKTLEDFQHPVSSTKSLNKKLNITESKIIDLFIIP